MCVRFSFDRLRQASVVNDGRSTSTHHCFWRKGTAWWPLGPSRRRSPPHSSWWSGATLWPDQSRWSSRFCRSSRPAPPAPGWGLRATKMEWERTRQRRGGGQYLPVLFTQYVSHTQNKTELDESWINQALCRISWSEASLHQLTAQLIFPSAINWQISCRAHYSSCFDLLTLPVSSTSCFATNLHHSSSFMLNYSGGHVEGILRFFLSFTHISLIYVLQFGFVF